MRFSKMARLLCAMLVCALVAATAACSSRGPTPRPSHSSASPSDCPDTTQDPSDFTAIMPDCSMFSLRHILNTAWKLYGVTPLPTLKVVAAGEHIDCVSGSGHTTVYGDKTMFIAPCGNNTFAVTILEFQRILTDTDGKLSLIWMLLGLYASGVVYTETVQAICAGAYFAARAPGFNPKTDPQMLNKQINIGGEPEPVAIAAGLSGRTTGKPMRQVCDPVR